MSKNVRVWPWLLLALAPLAGCSSSANPQLPRNQGELKEIYTMYERHIKSHQKPPSELEDLANYEPIYPAAFKAIKDGKCIVVWNVNSRTPARCSLMDRRFRPRAARCSHGRRRPSKR